MYCNLLKGSTIFCTIWFFSAFWLTKYGVSVYILIYHQIGRKILSTNSVNKDVNINCELELCPVVEEGTTANQLSNKKISDFIDINNIVQNIWSICQKSCCQKCALSNSGKTDTDVVIRWLFTSTGMYTFLSSLNLMELRGAVRRTSEHLIPTEPSHVQFTAFPGLSLDTWVTCDRGHVFPVEHVSCTRCTNVNGAADWFSG